MNRTLLLLPLLAACDVMGNAAPRLVSLNGAEYNATWGLPERDPGLMIVPGERLELKAEVKDAQRDAIRIWWPWQPEGFAWEPDATEGHWDVPMDIELDYRFELVMLLEDDHRKPRQTEIRVPVWIDGGDTWW